ncbi:hypothetical protein Syun_022683 [Stephania yunnanensis]|uniref:Uncharacterized protein n=1 Tax=Stephania yunnanensis TaxID=152371 RepID=A0AAP0FA48_9MAGN
MNDEQRNNKTQTQISSNCCNCSSDVDKVMKYTASACTLCVCCPLAILWCFVKLPINLGWKLAKRATTLCCCCCSASRTNKILAPSSSFSDLDLDLDISTNISNSDFPRPPRHCSRYSSGARSKCN